MDDSVRAAMRQWPDVPDVYGWLRLDRRGRWLLRGERIINPALKEFIGRNYLRIDGGGYVFQNGPQRVHVELEATPWIATLAAVDTFVDHTGRALDALVAVWLDAQGQLILEDQRGPALLHDADLLPVLEQFCGADGAALTEPQWAAVLQGEPSTAARWRWNDALLPVYSLGERGAEQQFGFVAQPRPAPRT